MGKDKLRRFAEIATFPNVFELLEGKPLKGNWAEGHFKNDHPVILELACGKGEYTVCLAELFPDKNFIGVDYKGNRIWRGAKTALEKGISNVAFLRIQIEELQEFFGENEISEIWITFPDPQPQAGREKKRLTASRFLEQYRSILKSGGPVHLKTDNDAFYDFSLSQKDHWKLVFHDSTRDLYQTHPNEEILGIKTYYEQKYLKNDKNINYLKFSFGEG